MPRWRVDYLIRAGLIPAAGSPDLIIRDDESVEIHLRESTGPRTSDSHSLVAYVLIEAPDLDDAMRRARPALQRTLDMLSFATNHPFEIVRPDLAVDWTPGLSRRQYSIFTPFENPDGPATGLSQELLDTAAFFQKAGEAPAVQLAARWWSHGLTASTSEEQFLYFWFALEVLAEILRETTPVPDRCTRCRGPLFCPTCNEVPSHRPYPKQAIQALIEKHLRGDAETAFAKFDKARNMLMHGRAPREIEKRVDAAWPWLANNVGRAVWAAMVSHLRTISADAGTHPENLAHVEPDFYTIMAYGVQSNFEDDVRHVDPMNPQFDEFTKSEIKVTIALHEERGRGKP